LLESFGIGSYFDSSPDSLGIHSFGGRLTIASCIEFSDLRVNNAWSRSLCGLGWGWRTSAATDQGIVSRKGDWMSVMDGPGVCDERGGRPFRYLTASKQVEIASVGRLKLSWGKLACRL
jgi:hypothetical protein